MKINNIKNMDIKSIEPLLSKKMELFIAENKFKDKELVIWGANKPAEKVIKILECNGYKIKYIVDIDSIKRKASLEGKIPFYVGEHQLYAPEDVLCNKIENKIILIASKAYHDICTQLIKMGYDVQNQTIDCLDFGDINIYDMPQKGLFSLEDMQREELKILVYFEKTCEKMGLRHYIAGGTLLGAVRHQGFIPWDDDIDVIMPVSDYFKFLVQFQENDEFAVEHCGNALVPFQYCRMVSKKTCLIEEIYPYVRKTGVNIDIFPLSGFPGEGQEADQYRKKLINHKNEWEEFWNDIGTKEFTMERYKHLAQISLDLLEKYSFDEMPYAGYILTCRFQKNLNPIEMFQKTVLLDFEGEKLTAPHLYDMRLKIAYGDYMKLPPKEQQIARHKYKAWYV